MPFPFAFAWLNAILAVRHSHTAYQRQQLSIILAAAQAAEDEVHQVQGIARGLIVQGFFYDGCSVEEAVSAYPSQAEETLAQYNADGGNTKFGRNPLNCWVCGRNHSWMKGKIIVMTQQGRS
jgi:hypothetical protein